MNRRSTEQAVIVTVIVTVLLIAGFIGVWLNVDIVTFDFEDAFLVSVFFSIALFGVVIFQSLRGSERAVKMATELAQATLESSHNLYTELYQSSPIPYLLVNEDGTIDSVNTAAVRLFETGMGRLNGEDFFEMLESEDQQHLSLLKERPKKGISIHNEEIWIRTADDELIWVLLSVFPFDDAVGSKKFLITLVDINAQKKVDQVKSEFVSLASHQLRTPIAAMKWNLELLIAKHSGELTATQREYLKKFEKNLVRMDKLVGDFLNVAKLELGTFVANDQSVSPREVIEELVEEYRERAESKEVSIVTKIDERILPVTTDPQLIRMILGNVVSNAVKYTPQSGTVTLRVGQKGSQVLFEVSDTGIGIPIEEHDKIFGKIYRASNARLKVAEGTGLGLYIAKQASEVIGGVLSFVSVENEGTTFTLALQR